jgi:hypothetical protein
MTLQAIRRFYEAPLISAFGNFVPTVPVYVDNQPLPDTTALSEYVLLRLSFGLITEPTLAANFDWHRGSLVIEVYSAKGVGPGRGQALIQTAIDTLTAMNATQGTAVNNVRGSIGPIVGPSFFALEGTPHYLTRISTAFQARYTA